MRIDNQLVCSCAIPASRMKGFEICPARLRESIFCQGVKGLGRIGCSECGIVLAMLSNRSLWTWDRFPRLLNGWNVRKFCFL
jgi:hypothetical protein